MDLIEIRDRIAARFNHVDVDATELATHLDNLDFVDKYEIVDGELRITYNQLVLVSHDGDETLNLGKLVAVVMPDRSYRVYRDTNSERDEFLSDDKIHPHVNSGSVCLGNGIHVQQALIDDGDIAMFTVLMWDFLNQYSNTTIPYWKAFMYNPCRECARDFDCKFCKCTFCGDLNDDNVDCGNCGDAGCLSKRSISRSTVDLIYQLETTLSTETLMEIHNVIKNFEV